MKDKKKIDLIDESTVAKFAFEMGMELLKPALKNHKDEFAELMKKWIRGSITNKEIFDRLIEFRRKLNINAKMHKS